MLTGFYGNSETSKRSLSWDLLKAQKPPAGKGWCAVGDFNEIMAHDEKMGGRIRTEGQMESFIRVLEETGLADLGWNGNKYIWNNGHEGVTFIKERLDRVVANHV